MICELQPFNQARFDACMAWVAKKFETAVTQYQAVKIHALADALHVVEFHRAIIGGTLKKLPNGPVDLQALNRAKAWDGDEDAPFSLGGETGNICQFIRKDGPTHESMFTAAERKIILQAAAIVFGMSFGESQKFFHGSRKTSPGGFLGHAWGKTKRDKGSIPWETIIDAYAEQAGEDADELKALICL